MNPEEKEDLRMMKERVAQLKIEHFDYIDMLMRTPENELKSSGYKTYDQALRLNYVRTKQAIDKVMKEFLRKYPDEN
jgi:hypothetical protein